jgi:hypothetical protein
MFDFLKWLFGDFSSSEDDSEFYAVMDELAANSVNCRHSLDRNKEESN